ncbi:aldo/keto reductase [Candidatus Poribacteria bacterium]|nr:aldo/keto reductase [Candidatus Poribacteria bacterium]
MLLRPFGNTGLQVSALGFGAGHIGGHGMEDSAAARLLGEVLDLGINLIDTARGYGLSEQRIGRHLAHRRSEFALVSKCGYGIEGTENWTGPCITRGIEEALRLLRTDVIDVMLLHSCPIETLRREDIPDALDSAVEQGKVRVAGYSGENEALEFAASCGRFRALETSVNLFDQRSLNRVLPKASAQGLGVIAKRPAANAPWRHESRPAGDYCEVYWERMNAMGLELGGMDWLEAALRFACHSPGVSTAIVGTGSMEHLRENVRVAELGPLPDGLVSHIRSRFQERGEDWDGQV